MDVIKRNTDYALRLMARLAWYDGGDAIPARRLAEEEGVSTQLASKLLQQLSGAGLVQSRMGKRGGFLLPPRRSRWPR
jgi:Rrf2 family protein